MAIHADQIVPWGRSYNEYCLMFSLSGQDLSGGVLDCGGGPSSFTAELSACGHRAVSVDPVYAHSGSVIRAGFEAAAEPMLAQVRATPDDWTWSYHRDPDDLLANRRAALESFLADYERGLRDCRYVVGELPSLPFASGSFRLAVCSHLLFLWSALLSESFHIESLRELCRVAHEVRVFPLLTLRREPSPHLDAVRSALDAEGWTSEVVRVNYELQRGGNEMLRVFRA
jgi:hypothetical protein